MDREASREPAEPANRVGLEVRATRARLTDAIRTVVDGDDLDEATARAAADAIMGGHATPAQIAGLLVGLRMKGEAVPEITGFARAMRERVERVPVDPDRVVDPCGTGGDGKGTFNISTVSAFIAAGAGVRVAKHGNCSVSSLCGSSELLEALGVEISLGPAEAARAIDEVGLGFLFAPRYHGATRHAVGPRRDVGVRSIFNIVGPLTNPALAKRQVLGVYDEHLTEPLAEVLRDLGSTHCMVVHGEDGLDELTLAGKTRVSELKNGLVLTYDVDPSDYGLDYCASESMRGGDPATNAKIAEDVLAGQDGPERRICLLNAAASIKVAGIAVDIADGVRRATRSLDSGAAADCLRRLRERRFAGTES